MGSHLFIFSCLTSLFIFCLCLCRLKSTTEELRMLEVNNIHNKDFNVVDDSSYWKYSLFIKRIDLLSVSFLWLFVYPHSWFFQVWKQGQLKVAQPQNGLVFLNKVLSIHVYWFWNHCLKCVICTMQWNTKLATWKAFFKVVPGHVTYALC